jgi:hypothetical protein
MKRSDLVICAGGILVAVAVFLPMYLANPSVGVFGPGRSLLSGIQQDVQAQGSMNTLYLPLILNVATALLEPAGAVLLITAGLLAGRVGRAAYVWGLAGAVLSLILLGWQLTVWSIFIYYPDGHGISAFQVFGIGYWLAIIGSVLGLAGVLLGWWGRPTLRRSLAQAQNTQARRPALRPGPEALLVLAGTLVALISFFLPAFVLGPGSTSLLNILIIPVAGIELLWSDVLALLLLLGCGLLALTGRKAGYLGSLAGALVGVSFLLLLEAPFLGFPESNLFNAPPGAPYWLTVFGYALGLVGALLGLRARKASPASADARVVPSPS